MRRPSRWTRPEATGRSVRRALAGGRADLPPYERLLRLQVQRRHHVRELEVERDEVEHAKDLRVRAYLRDSRERLVAGAALVELVHEREEGALVVIEYGRLPPVAHAVDDVVGEAGVAGDAHVLVPLVRALAHERCAQDDDLSRAW